MGPLGWFAVGASILGAFESYEGNKASADAMRQGAEFRMQAARFEQAQATQQAGQAVAAGQRQAEIETRNAAYVQSRQLALAAASGAGASDPGMANLIARTAGEGSYRSAVALYHGEEQSRQLLLQGQAAMFSGEVTARGMLQRGKAYDLSATGSLISGAGQAVGLYGKYAGTGPSGGGDSTLIKSGNLSWGG